MESHNESSFEVQKSPVSEAYALLSADNPLDLLRKYTEADQVLMKSHTWDYENSDLIINKVKDIIESVGLENVHDPEESEWCKEILWFWYHHAMSCAIWRYKDKEKALEVSSKAMELHGRDHPNGITPVLYYLIRGDVQSAEKAANDILNNKDGLNDKDLALELIEEYKAGEFFA